MKNCSNYILLFPFSKFDRNHIYTFYAFSALLCFVSSLVTSTSTSWKKLIVFSAQPTLCCTCSLCSSCCSTCSWPSSTTPIRRSRLISANRRANLRWETTSRRSAQTYINMIIILTRHTSPFRPYWP